MVGPVKVLLRGFFRMGLFSPVLFSGGEGNERRGVVATVDQTDMRGLGTA
jgi:hypothetical protein